MRFSKKDNATLISRKYKSGHYQRIAKGVYLENAEKANPRAAIIKNIEMLFTQLNIKGTLAYASALKYPNPHKNTYILTGTQNKEVKLEGCNIAIKVFKANDQESKKDETIRVSETDCFQPYRERGVLENYSTRRADRIKVDKEFAREWIRDQIEIRNGDKERISKMKKAFTAKGKLLGREKEAGEVTADIDKLCEVFMSTYSGMPYDAYRVKKFRALRDEFLHHSFVGIEGMDYSDQLLREKLAFFESYFSNYIEGTEFTVDEAKDILVHKRAYDRHQDGHDIIRHYELTLGNPNPIVFDSFETFIESIKQTHIQMLSHRGATGVFKAQNNQVGQRMFVDKEMVLGTLQKAFEISHDIDDLIKKAFFLTICFVEIHPFEDGNGRLGRVLMNSLLQKEGRKRLIIPTVLREDYVLGLQSFTQNSNMPAVARLFDRIIEINNSIDYNSDLDDIIAYLDGKSAFMDPKDGKWGETPISMDDPLEGVISW